MDRSRIAEPPPRMISGATGLGFIENKS